MDAVVTPTRIGILGCGSIGVAQAAELGRAYANPRCGALLDDVGVFVGKAIKSAVANYHDYLETHNIRGGDAPLFIAEARADEGPTIKRFQPKDRGKAHPIMKRTSHLVISVDERE